MDATGTLIPVLSLIAHVYLNKYLYVHVEGRDLTLALICKRRRADETGSMRSVLV